MSKELQEGATNAKYTELYEIEGAKHGKLW